MKQVPTLDELSAQLESQDAEFAAATELAASIPNHVVIAESALEDFELVEPEAPLGVQLFCFGIRA